MPKRNYIAGRAVSIRLDAIRLRQSLFAALLALFAALLLASCVDSPIDNNTSSVVTRPPTDEEPKEPEHRPDTAERAGTRPPVRQGTLYYTTVARSGSTPVITEREIDFDIRSAVIALEGRPPRSMELEMWLKLRDLLEDSLVTTVRGRPIEMKELHLYIPKVYLYPGANMQLDDDPVEGAGAGAAMFWRPNNQGDWWKVATITDGGKPRGGGIFSVRGVDTNRRLIHAGGSIEFFLFSPNPNDRDTIELKLQLRIGY